MTNDFRKEFSNIPQLPCCYVACESEAVVYYQCCSLDGRELAFCNYHAEHVALGMLRDVAAKVIGEEKAQANHVAGYAAGVYMHKIIAQDKRV